MRAAVLGPEFGFKNIQWVPRPKPTPAPHEVLLRMRSVSLNYRDVLMIQGKYNPRQPLPLVPCSDGVGVVEAVGANVSMDWLGQRVTPLFAQTWMGGALDATVLKHTLGGPLEGTLQEWMCIPATAMVPVPAHLSDTEAACLPCAGVTAYRALVELGGLKRGQRVLLQGTGGVSVFALQIAKALGASVFMTTSRSERMTPLRTMGADAVANYRDNPNWWRDCRAWSDGKGVDVVVEVGGAQTLETSLRVVAPGGHISVIGVLSGVMAQIPLTRLLMHQVCLQGVFVGSKETAMGLSTLFTQHQLHPHVDTVFPVSKISEALEYLVSGAHFGKVVLSFDESL